ncbi:Angiotensin-converting enzyme [Papilio xuthus]|uniref:Angiotensin-converting enzyme n=1 Tax=Papilio xuthus TaxID=66420 RepID=A0A194PSY9_PAPXU|nr:Angiotensin-converting enzyme [Papilio xuthus]
MDKANTNEDNILEHRSKKEQTLCFKQKDVDDLITKSKDEKVLKWIWKMWRQETGTSVKEYFKTAVDIENRAARRNGYTDVGESWREELEISNLRHYCRQLFQSVKPLYTLLHGVVRYFLRKKYGDVVPIRGPIPAHLLGNLWTQNWEPISDLIIPKSINIDESMKKKKWDVKHMQANSAFHESIGDAITIGVMTPQHLNRLGLINDTTLYSTNKDHAQAVPNVSNEDKENNTLKDSIKDDTNQLINANTDEILLLKRALNKIPQIPFSLLIDEYRWKYFENNIDAATMNKEFWAMSLEIQGISPPEDRNEEFFDLGAVYYVADNTPYIRKFMSHGNSQHWREILRDAFNEDDISAAALLRYYRPLEDFLIRLVEKHNIPLGW